MDRLNLALAIAGIVLGLISAWPKISSWASSAKNTYSARAKRVAAKRILRFKLAASDPSYLLAYIARNLTIGASLLWLATGLKGFVSEIEAAVVTIFIIRTVISLSAGVFFGSVIGLTLVIVSHKERDRTDG